MPNPLDFLIRRGVGGVQRGIDALGGQLDPARRQPMPQGADVNPAELAQVHRALPPSFNGTPHPVASATGCGNSEKECKAGHRVLVENHFHHVR